MRTYQKHYVTFFSPGTFVAEQSRREVSTWDTRAAAQLAREIVERHGAQPYAFQFSTYLKADPIPDGQGGALEVKGREEAVSCLYYLNGQVLTYRELAGRDDSKQRGLLANMRCNRWPLVVQTRTPWIWTQPFEPADRVVDADGQVIEAGDAPRWMAYREEQIAAWKTSDDD